MKRHLNLMSERARKREDGRRAWRVWAQVVAVLVLVLTPTGLVRWYSCNRAEQHSLAADLQYKPTRQLRADSGRLKQQIEQFRTDERVALALAVERPALALMGLVSRAVAERKGSVYLDVLELQQSPLVTDAPSGQKATFVLGGTGRDALSVTKFADMLRNNGPFSRVDVQTEITDKPGADNVPAFEIECEF
jgi:hypothetical protein